MYCINCGTKNKDNSKFCTSCGEKLEVEEKEEKVSTAEDIVDKVKNKRKEFLEHKYDAKVGDTTGIRINGKEIKVDNSPTISHTTTNNTSTSNSNSNSKTGLIVAIVIISILVLGTLSIATVFICKDFIMKERTPISSKRDNPTIKKDNKRNNINDWEISYTIPEELETTSDSTNLKMYKYRKDGSMCSMNIWKLTYIPEGETEETLIKKYSQIYPKTDINITTKDINGKEWKYIEKIGNWNKYEYGRFSEDKEAFYSIRTTDYDPDTGKCKELFDQVINSISYE